MNNRRIIIEFNADGSATLDSLCALTGQNASVVVHRALTVLAIAHAQVWPDGGARIAGADGQNVVYKLSHGGQ